MKKFETPVINIEKFNMEKVVMLSAVDAAVQSLEGDVTEVYKIKLNTTNVNAN